jgi:hypothetical protein
MTTKQTMPMDTKISVRLNEKQLKVVQKAAKAHKMNLAEYVRACILWPIGIISEKKKALVWAFLFNLKYLNTFGYTNRC